MIVKLELNEERQGGLRVKDGVVMLASPKYHWCVGMEVNNVLSYFQSKGYTWTISGD
jgi:hypothetical protein